MASNYDVIVSLAAVSALLLTGRPGVGKTSIVKAVTKSIQEDIRTLTCMCMT